MSVLLELTAHPGAIRFNITEILAQIAKEYRETSDQTKRESLLNLHNSCLNIVQGQIKDADDLAKFLDERSRHYWGLLLSELTNAEGLIDPEEVERITAREIAAGRMTADDKIRKLSLHHAGIQRQVRDEDASPPSNVAPKPASSLWRRLVSTLMGV